MKQQQLSLDGFEIIGIQVRTTNAAEMSGAGKIGGLWAQFFSDGIMAKIPAKLDGNLLGVYHDYESDANGAYSMLIGVKVTPGTKAPEGMQHLQIPKQKYTRFTSEKGEMPGVIIQVWGAVWEMAAQSLLKRKYAYDFELYDERSSDPKSAEVDLFIALQD